MSHRTKEKSVKKYPLFEQRSCEFGDFSFSTANRQIKAVLYVKEKGKITNSDYQFINSVSKRTATNDLTELVSKSLLKRIGTSGSSIWYEVVGQ